MYKKSLLLLCLNFLISSNNLFAMEGEKQIGISAGYLKTFGKVNDLLDSGLAISLMFTPEIGFKKINDQIQAIYSPVSLSSELNFLHFSGPIANRTANYVGPSLKLTYAHGAFCGNLMGGVKAGVGVTWISRDNYSSSQLSSLLGLFGGYEKEFSFGKIGSYLDVGTITDKNYPINHVGISLKYGYKY